MSKAIDTQKELQTLRALGMQIVDLSSRLLNKPAPVKGHASNKKKDPVQLAIDKRNRRLQKR